MPATPRLFWALLCVGPACQSPQLWEGMCGQSQRAEPSRGSFTPRDARGLRVPLFTALTLGLAPWGALWVNSLFCRGGYMASVASRAVSLQVMPRDCSQGGRRVGAGGGCSELCVGDLGRDLLPPVQVSGAACPLASHVPFHLQGLPGLWVADGSCTRMGSCLLQI